MPFLCLYFFGFYYISNVVKFDFSVTKVVGDFVGESICSLSCPFAVFKRVFARFHRTFGVLHAIKKDPEKWLLYCCFVLEKAEKPVTNEEKYSKRNLSDFVNNNLELVESENESVNPE